MVRIIWVHPSITRFFGIGLTPLPATYTCKKLGCTQILLTIIHLILLLNCLDFFDPYYLVIVNVVFVSACRLMHGLLIVGANEKISLMIHIWVSLTIFCLAYMLYFVWFMAALSFYPKVTEDTFNQSICYVLLGLSILEILFHVNGIYLANKTLREIREDTETQRFIKRHPTKYANDTLSSIYGNMKGTV
jgi:hypothetical protein